MTGNSGPDFVEEPVMYVVTNDTRVNGAVSVLLPDVVQSLYDRIGDFFVLGSSIHEVIAVPKATADPHTLLQMVIDINRTQVAPEDRLADDVFEIRNGSLVSVFTPNEHQMLQRYAPAWLAE